MPVGPVGALVDGALDESDRLILWIEGENTGFVRRRQDAIGFQLQLVPGVVWPESKPERNPGFDVSRRRFECFHVLGQA